MHFSPPRTLYIYIYSRFKWIHGFIGLSSTFFAIIIANHIFKDENFLIFGSVVDELWLKWLLQIGSMVLYFLIPYIIRLIVKDYRKTKKQEDPSQSEPGNPSKPKNPGNPSPSDDRLDSFYDNATKYAFLIILIIIVLVLIYAIFKTLFPFIQNILQDNPTRPIEALFDLISVVLLVVAAILGIIALIIAAIKMIVIQIKSIPKSPHPANSEEQDKRTDNLSNIITIAVFIVSVILTIYFAKENGNPSTIDAFINWMVDGNYVVLPLTLLVLTAIGIVVIKMYKSLFKILWTPNKFDAITERATKIIKTIIDIVLAAFESVLKFVKFIPSFFNSLSEIVLDDEDDDVDNEKKSDENKKTDHVEAKSDKKKKKVLKACSIAAFCFALVSFKATADGLAKYVFSKDNALIAYLLSFGIQAFLFMLNLQLPTFIPKIYQNYKEHKALTDQETEKKASYIETKKSCSWKIATSVFMCVILTLTSSIFSFVFICTEAYSGTRYIDANYALSKTYSEVLSDANEYVNEYIKYSQIEVGEALTALINAHTKLNSSSSASPIASTTPSPTPSPSPSPTPDPNTPDPDASPSPTPTPDYSTLSSSDLVNKYKEYEEQIVIFEDQRIIEESGLADLFEKYRKVGSLPYYEQVKEFTDEIDAIDKQIYNIESEMSKIKNLMDRIDSLIISNLLAEILQPFPDINVLNEHIETLNDYVVSMDNAQYNSSAYADVIREAQRLKIAISSYITLIELQGNYAETAAPSETPSPSATPSASPAGSPSTSPSASPAGSPSASPSASPTSLPSNSPTAIPSETPTPESIASLFDRLTEEIEIPMQIVETEEPAITSSGNTPTGSSATLSPSATASATPTESPTEEPFVDANNDGYDDNDVAAWTDSWEERLQALEMVLRQLPSYTANDTDGMVLRQFRGCTANDSADPSASANTNASADTKTYNENILTGFDPQEKANKISDMMRKNLADINLMERAFIKLFFDEYNGLAVGSFVFAFFCDLSAMIAGLIIFFMEKKYDSNPSSPPRK